MRFVCPICGYIYDESKEGTPFAQLPESWVCPLCKAPKSLFTPEKPARSAPAPSVPPANQVSAAIEGDGPSAGVLAALCSNLARGCEKQYKEEASALFRQLADYFTAAAPAAQGDLAQLAALLRDDLDQGYPTVQAAAEAAGDRGTQRVRVWGEKVTQMLSALIGRYQQEGEAFLQNTQVWVCSVCGFIYIGDEPPQICPVCKVPAWKFDKVEGRG